MKLQMNLQFCSWESEVLGVRVYNLRDFAHSNRHDAIVDGSKLQQLFDEHDAALVSVDTHFKYLHDIHALMENGFHIAIQYYEWRAIIEEVVGNALKYINRFSMIPIAREHGDDVSRIAATEIRNGRFADPYLPDGWREKLYGAWGRNLCHGYADLGLVCRIEDSIAGFIAAKINGAVASINLIAVADKYQGVGCGISMVAELIHLLAIRPKAEAHNPYLPRRDIEMVIARTDTANYPINAIYSAGLRLGIGVSGLMLHWVRRGVPGVRVGLGQMGTAWSS